MRALVMTRFGRPEVLEVEERPDPEPGAGAVRVAVRAAGVNFADLVARLGLYRKAPRPPAVLGFEFSGTVDRQGEGATRFSPGDRVIGACWFGGYAELAIAAEDDLVRMPDDLSFEEGAGLPVNYAAAYAGLIRYGSLQPRERVLVHSAGGGVGVAATQLAKLHDAEVFGTASPAKHDALREFGVDHPIDYRSRDFSAEVRRIAGAQRPLDLVLDPVAGSSHRRSFSLLAPGGRLVCYGASAAFGGERRSLARAARMALTSPWFSSFRLGMQSRAVIGLDLGELWESKGNLGELTRPLAALLEARGIRPVVAEAFPLERGADAHRFVHARRNVGKVVLTV